MGRLVAIGLRSIYELKCNRSFSLVIIFAVKPYIAEYPENAEKVKKDIHSGWYNQVQQKTGVLLELELH